MNPHAYAEPRPGTYQAQNGEDRWLEAYFGGKRDGVYVDVGAYDGVVISNTYHFEQIGWSGVLIEPDPIKAALCSANRPRSKVFQCAAVSDPRASEIVFHRVPEGPVYSTANLTPEHQERITDRYGLRFEPTRVPARTLDSILEESRIARIDFVSIDVEEGELGVLEGFDIRRWRPGLVLVEENRARRKEIRDYFVRNGFAFHTAIEFNHVYRRRAMSLVCDRVLYLLHQVNQYRASHGARS